MAEQERFSRNKRAKGESPVDAIEFCLRFAGIELGDIAAVGLGWDYSRTRDLYGEPTDCRDHVSVLFPERRFPRRALPPVFAIDHHTAHAASAYWPSGFGDAAVLVIDGGGELESTTIAHGQGPRLEIIEQIPLPFSLGNYYAAATRYIGFRARDAGKFMGLAAYGRPDQDVPLAADGDGLILRGLPRFLPSGQFSALDHFRARLLEHFALHNYPYRQGDGSEIFAYVAFASSIQRSLEQALVYLAERARQLTGAQDLALAGGVALNCTANGAIARAGLFERIFVQPAAADSGVALGAALEVGRRSGAVVCRRPMTHAYWGPAYSQEEIEAALHRHRLPFRRLSEDRLVDEAARRIEKNQLVGFYSGRAEIGPRALGARSILGNPAYRGNLVRINVLKGREVWRPLAPSVTVEGFSDFFEGPSSSPFMIVATQVRPEACKRIPAVTHIDGSARPQVVARETHPRFWKLLNQVGELTGAPVVINTSFNLAGEPIVNSPDEAIVDFLKSDLDALIVGDALVDKRQG